MNTNHRLIMATTYHQLVERVRETATAALPPAGHLLDDGTGDRSTKALTPARKGWRQVDSTLEHIDAELARLVSKTQEIGQYTDLTFEARQAMLNELLTNVNTSVTSDSEQVVNQVNEILAGLRTASMPSRPTETASEGVLANLRSDIRMVLDSVGDFGEIENRMAAMLERALTEGDKAATWLLATSHWGEDYLTSRGFGDYTSSWEHQRQALLDKHVTGEVARVRETYRRLANPQSGLAALRTVVATLPGVINDLYTDAQSRPVGVGKSYAQSIAEQRIVT